MTRLLLSVTLVAALAETAFAQPTCELDEAARAYASGVFDQAQQLITTCLAGRPTE